MRKAINIQDRTSFNVVEHIITNNLWEYYITDDRHSPDIVRAYVLGFANEMSDVSLSEIAPYVYMKSVGGDLDGILPPEGYKWED